MRTARCTFLGALVALAGCGNPDRSAGGSSYETENAVAARIVHPDGSPASGALVRARPLGWVEGDAFDSSFDQRADTQGRIRLQLPFGAWRLEARQNGVFAAIDVPTAGLRREFGEIRLTTPASVLGRTEPGARVGVHGLQRSALADAAGFFHIDSLPAGVHVLRWIGSGARSFVQAHAGQTLDAGILRTDIDGQILLEDFEDGDARQRYGAWTGEGWWWLDATSGVNLSPDGMDADPRRAIFADGGGGSILHFSAAFPADSDTSARARCGVDFGPAPLDLSDLRSVRFRARGIGTVTILVNSEATATSDVPQASVVLDSSWREFDVPVSNLRIDSASGATADSSARAMRLRRAVGLTWSLSASGDLWLDDIRLVGPSPSLLWGSSPPP